jgi:hypothetical protein
MVSRVGEPALPFRLAYRTSHFDAAPDHPFRGNAIDLLSPKAHEFDAPTGHNRKELGVHGQLNPAVAVISEVGEVVDSGGEHPESSSL